MTIHERVMYECPYCKASYAKKDYLTIHIEKCKLSGPKLKTNDNIECDLALPISLVGAVRTKCRGHKKSFSASQCQVTKPMILS